MKYRFIVAWTRLYEREISTSTSSHKISVRQDRSSSTEHYEFAEIADAIRYNFYEKLRSIYLKSKAIIDLNLVRNYILYYILSSKFHLYLRSISGEYRVSAVIRVELSRIANFSRRRRAYERIYAIYNDRKLRNEANKAKFVRYRESFEKSSRNVDVILDSFSLSYSSE